MDKPKTKKEDLIEDIFGHKIPDPYRWLEDNNSQEVKNWIRQQNDYTDSFLRTKDFLTISEELIKNYKTVDFSTPFPTNGFYFYKERKPGEDQFTLYFKRDLDGEAVKLIDPNEISKTTTISYWFPSRSAKYVAYGLSVDGDEMSTLLIRDVEKNTDSADKIERCRYSSVTWLPDDTGFFYTKNPKPGEVPEGEEHLHEKVFLHIIGKNPDNDQLIFGANRPKDDMLDLTLSVDGRYLAIEVAQKWTENDIFIYDTQTKQTTELVVGKKAQFKISFVANLALIYTDYQANNFRLLSISLDKLLTPIDKWPELVPEDKYPLIGISTTKDLILLEYIVNACSQLKIVDHTGQPVDGWQIELPPFSTIVGFGTNRVEKDFFLSITSFTFPKKIFYLNNGAKQLYREVGNPINSDDYVIRQEWCESKDGTKVPSFIFHHKQIDLSKPQPTILYAYGGFGSNEMPSFLKSWIPWVSRGGLFVIANIRGGGEFGRDWHQQGIKDKKQNSFDDFISVAEYLITKGYTSKEKLGILGGSNGGLLVSAVSAQRPDLFKAVCAKVPLTDMVRFLKFGIAIRWIHEYGNPETEEDLRNILKWSPYHNIKNNVNYPSYLFTTADKDTRVHSLHARKMTALLQEVSDDNKVLLFTESQAGHGPGKPISKIIEGQALIISFFSQELGLEI